MNPQRTIILGLYAAAHRGYSGLFLRQRRPLRKTGASDSFEVEGDAVATLLGDAYRGSGALVGMLGALVIFCAIAPLGFELSGPPALVFGVAELSLMVLIVAILFDARTLKHAWVQARQRAEINRYAPLEGSLAGGIGDVEAALVPLFGGDQCQIRYNQQKRRQYDRMERAANSLSMTGFAVAMLGAAAHLAFHSPWLIFFTAFLPAAVGALHGINAFLQIGQLGEDHRVLGLELERRWAAFREARSRSDDLLARAEAKEIYKLLIDAQSRWLTVAERVKVRAP